MSIRLFSVALAAVALTILVGGCQQGGQSPEAERSNLTSGMAKKKIVIGKTNQSEILEVFGPPNLVTHRDGREVWTYDRISQEIQRSDGYFTVLLAGAGSSSQKSSSVSTMLIVYFDDREIVQDYKLSVARF